jgi:APA family basic amino acid/polyamine antiporter
VIGDFGIHLPTAWATSPLAMRGQTLHRTGANFNLPAAAIVGAVMLSQLGEVKKSSAMNVAIVVIKLSAVFLFIGFGLAHADPANWAPFLPPREMHPDGSGAFGLAGVLQAAGIVFFAYLGFDALATTAQETRNPQRALPIAILGTLAISTVLYMAVALTMTGLAPFRTLGTDAPISTAIAAAGPQLAWLKTYVGVAVTIGLWSAVWPCIFGLSRLVLYFAQDGLLPARLATIDAGAKTPRNALLAVGFAGMPVAGFLPISLLGELISTGTLIAFATVCASVVRLRLSQPDRPRPFRVPLWWLTAPLGIAACLFLLSSMGIYAFARIVAWQLLGLLVIVPMTLRRRAAAVA